MKGIEETAQSSLRLVPTVIDGSSSTASVKDTANSLGTHDTLRYGQRSLKSDVTLGSTLQGRLDNVSGKRILSEAMLRRRVVISCAVGGDAGQPEIKHAEKSVRYPRASTIDDGAQDC